MSPLGRSFLFVKLMASARRSGPFQAPDSARHLAAFPVGDRLRSAHESFRSSAGCFGVASVAVNEDQCGRPLDQERHFARRPCHANDGAPSFDG